MRTDHKPENVLGTGNSHEQNRLLLPPHEVGLAATQHLRGKDTGA